MARPFGVALTGGIGSGKSTVASIFAKSGIAIIDTDEISRSLTSENGQAIPEILQAFGSEYVAEGNLDRAKMRKLVFSDDASRKRLESLLHPMILEEAERRISRVSSPYYILVVPLYFETGQYGGLADRILVVDCSEARQIRRAMNRSALGESEVRTILASQVPREFRRERADDILENEGSIEELEAEVRRLHGKYLAEYLKNPC